MRTTVTLDPDVEQLLRDTMHGTRKSFKATINEAVRQALGRPSQICEEPFTVQARALGMRRGIDTGRLNQLADELEVNAFLEISRRLEETDPSSS